MAGPAQERAAFARFEARANAWLHRRVSTVELGPPYLTFFEDMFAFPPSSGAR